MKKILFTLLLFFMTIASHGQNYTLCDCNHDGQVSLADVLMVVDVILNGYKPLTLSSDNVVVDYGSSATVNISSGYGPYDITCSDENIVGVSLNGTQLNITGKAVGTAVVTVTDTATGYTKDINVAVNKKQAASLCPDNHHPHLIDLGLPSGTKWACCNVGATAPEDYGGYYAWGETEEKNYYDSSTYQYYQNGSYVNLGSDIAGTQYDVARVKWGGSWVMPSTTQQQELLNNCTYEWTTVNGVKGRKFTSKTNGGSIFLPAAGYSNGSGLNGAGSGGNYWSSTQHPSNTYFAYYLYFLSDRTGWLNGGYRDFGRSVRPVVRN